MEPYKYKNNQNLSKKPKNMMIEKTIAKKIQIQELNKKSYSNKQIRFKIKNCKRKNQKTRKK